MVITYIAMMEIIPNLSPRVVFSFLGTRLLRFYWLFVSVCVADVIKAKVIQLFIMGLSCPLAVVSLFILELNSTLKSGKSGILEHINLLRTSP